MLEVFKDSNLDEIVIIGDYGDMYFVNQHGNRHPNLQHHLEFEVSSIRYGLRELETEFPNAQLVYIEGNHETRLVRYIMDKAPALFGVTDYKFLVGLGDRWRWVPYGPRQAYKVLGSKLHARHEPCGSTPKLSVARSMVNLTYGHIHRREEGTATNLVGENFVNFSAGWIGDDRKDEVFGYVKQHFQWNLGFALVDFDTESDIFYHQVVPIADNMTCAVNGKVYRG